MVLSAFLAWSHGILTATFVGQGTCITDGDTLIQLSKDAGSPSLSRKS